MRDSDDRVRRSHAGADVGVVSSAWHVRVRVRVLSSRAMSRGPNPGRAVREANANRFD
jgi:hypothetical protein